MIIKAKPYTARAHPLVVTAWLALGVSAAVQAETREATLDFSDDTHSQIVVDTLRGDDVIDYMVTVAAGETMSVKLNTNSHANYFSVMPADSETAVFVGNIDDNSWQSKVPETAEYRIHLYLVKSAARRDTTATFTLTVRVGGYIPAVPD